MSTRIRVFVVQSRAGWAVNLESDRVSDHPTPEAALEEAHHLADAVRLEGLPAQIVELTAV